MRGQFDRAISLIERSHPLDRLPTRDWAIIALFESSYRHTRIDCSLFECDCGYFFLFFFVMWPLFSCFYIVIIIGIPCFCFTTKGTTFVFFQQTAAITAVRLSLFYAIERFKWLSQAMSAIIESVSDSVQRGTSGGRKRYQRLSKVGAILYREVQVVGASDTSDYRK